MRTVPAALSRMRFPAADICHIVRTLPHRVFCTHWILRFVVWFHHAACAAYYRSAALPPALSPPHAAAAHRHIPPLPFCSTAPPPRVRFISQHAFLLHLPAAVIPVLHTWDFAVLRFRRRVATLPAAPHARCAPPPAFCRVSADVRSIRHRRLLLPPPFTMPHIRCTHAATLLDSLPAHSLFVVVTCCLPPPHFSLLLPVPFATMPRHLPAHRLRTSAFVRFGLPATFLPPVCGYWLPHTTGFSTHRSALYAGLHISCRFPFATHCCTRFTPSCAFLLPAFAVSRLIFLLLPPLPRLHYLHTCAFTTGCVLPYLPAIATTMPPPPQFYAHIYHYATCARFDSDYCLPAGSLHLYWVTQCVLLTPVACTLRSFLGSTITCSYLPAPALHTTCTCTLPRFTAPACSWTFLPFFLCHHLPCRYLRSTCYYWFVVVLHRHAHLRLHTPALLTPLDLPPAIPALCFAGRFWDSLPCLVSGHTCSLCMPAVTTSVPPTTFSSTHYYLLFYLLVLLPLHTVHTCHLCSHHYHLSFLPCYHHHYLLFLFTTTTHTPGFTFLLLHCVPWFYHLFFTHTTTPLPVPAPFGYFIFSPLPATYCYHHTTFCTPFLLYHTHTHHLGPGPAPATPAFPPLLAVLRYPTIFLATCLCLTGVHQCTHTTTPVAAAVPPAASARVLPCLAGIAPPRLAAPAFAPRTAFDANTVQSLVIHARA